MAEPVNPIQDRELSPGYDALEFIDKKSVEGSNDEINYAFLLATTTSGLNKVGKLRKISVTTPKFGVLFKPEILHEVCPGLGSCSDIVRINDALSFAAFEAGAVVPIKNFHSQNNFNCDVKARLTHHQGISRLVKSETGTHLAAAGIDCSFSVFDVDAEHVTFSHQQIAKDTHTEPLCDIQFISQSAGTILADCESHSSKGCDHLLATVAKDGMAKFWDVRLSARASITIGTLPKLTSLTALSDSTKVILGSDNGDCLMYDMRRSSEPLLRTKLSKERIYRVREIKLQLSGDRVHHSLVICSDQSKDLMFRNPLTFTDLSKHWKKIKSGGSSATNITDFRLVDDVIITCGYKTQMGFYKFVPSPTTIEKRWTTFQ